MSQEKNFREWVFSNADHVFELSTHEKLGFVPNIQDVEFESDELEVEDFEVVEMD